MEVSDQFHASATLHQGKAAGTYLMGGQVDHRVGLQKKYFSLVQNDSSVVRPVIVVILSALTVFMNVSGSENKI